MIFSDWNPGQPEGGLSQNCLVMYKPTAWHWHDGDCAYKRFGYICEKSL